MSTKLRKSARKDFKHFPVEYFELLERHRDGALARLGPMTRRQAQAGRMDLYRFFGFLRDAYKEDPTARIYSDIARSLTLTVEPAEPAYGRDMYFIVLSTNPIVAAMKET
jgi:hypothetical protein